MTNITLTRIEASVLSAAAEHPDRLLVLPEAMKPTPRGRLLGRFERDGLAEERDGQHRITTAAFKALGLTPPRKARTAPSDAATGEPGIEPACTKREQVRAMLARPDGATLAELVAATGWLPHTTRAALSRIRSAGQPLAKPRRADGSLAYRIEPAVEAAEVASARRGRRRAAEVAQAAA